MMDLEGLTHSVIMKYQRLELTAVRQHFTVDLKVVGCRGLRDLLEPFIHCATLALSIKHRALVVSSLIERKEKTASPIVKSGFSFTARNM